MPILHVSVPNVCSVFISDVSDNHAGDAAVVFGMLPTSQPI